LDDAADPTQAHGLTLPRASASAGRFLCVR